MIQYSLKGEIPSDDLEVLKRYSEAQMSKMSESVKGTLLELPNRHRYSIRLERNLAGSYASLTRG